MCPPPRSSLHGNLLYLGLFRDGAGPAAHARHWLRSALHCCNLHSNVSGCSWQAMPYACAPCGSIADLGGFPPI